LSYLLDTDIVSNPLKKQASLSLLRHLARVPAEEQYTSTITVGEMTFGAVRSSRPEELLQQIKTIAWANLQILPFDFEAAQIYGRVRAALEKNGTPVSEPDLRIAAIAISRGLTLVTGNERHFRHIQGLQVENWLREDE